MIYIYDFFKGSNIRILSNIVIFFENNTLSLYMRSWVIEQVLHKRQEKALAAFRRQDQI